MDRRITIQISGAAFLLYAGASLLWSHEPIYGAGLMLGLIAAFLFGYLVKDLRSIFVPYCLLLCLNGVLLLKYEYGFFGNPNYMGIAAVLGLAWALAYREWWFMPIGYSTVLYTQSRTAFIGAAIATFFAMPWRWRFMAVAGTILAILYLYGWRQNNDSSFARLGIIHDTLFHLTFFGHGLGSFFDGYWAFTVKMNMTEYRPLHAYNDYIELLYDLGIGTVPLWIALIFLLDGADPRPRLICIAVLAMSMTHYPLFMPVIGQLFACALGHAYRSHQWSPQDTVSKTSTISMFPVRSGSRES